MDGFAVRAVDTHGASASLPAYLTLVGEVPMGALATAGVGQGEAMTVHTSNMIPPNADAVVMMEHTRNSSGPDELEIYQPVAEGENVIQIGEDVRRGQRLLASGHRLRPQDIGGLAALGITEVEVARPPRVAILSQGDEVVPPDATPGPGQVRDVNSWTLAALTRRAGGEPVLDWPILADDVDAMEATAREALEATDVVVFSAGSSVSIRDVTATVIERLGEPGILAHGLSVKPGKPTVVAVCGGKPVLGLPGNPVSAMVVFQLVVAPTIRRLLGASAPSPLIRHAVLSRNLASAPGREDYVPVRIEEREGQAWACPVFGKSNLIYTLVRADGLVIVPLDDNGLSEGDPVDVQLL